MPEALHERVESLERSRSRWRLAAVASWVGLALVTVVAVAAFFVIRVATESQLAAIQEAEAARMEAQKAREEQQQAEDHARRLLYFSNVGLAQREWEAGGAKP
jgi:hypothetical protein